MPHPSSHRSLALLVLASLAPAPLAGAQTTRVLSVDSSGALANGRSDAPRITPDGRVVVFSSLANNLVAGDTNGFHSDVFVHEPGTGRTTRVSVSSGGVEGDDVSLAPSVSADGERIAFSSRATNLVPPDLNGASDVYLHDRTTGLTTLVSASSQGVRGDASSGTPVISRDGEVVAFVSSASNLVPGDTNLAQDVFYRNLSTGETRRASVDSSGAQGDAACHAVSISGDGRLLAFYSSGDLLVPGDQNGVFDVFVHDSQSGVTSRVSLGPGGAEADGPSFDPALSADGRYVAFSSVASNLVPGDTNGVGDIFVRDLATGLTERVSVDSMGREAHGYSVDPAISGDGRYVSFSSLAQDLVPGDSNGSRDVFLHDRLLGRTTRLSATPSGGNADDFSEHSSVSDDGRHVAFVSEATNLVSGDTNGHWDVFLRDLGAEAEGVSCGGRGPAESCPCGNLGAVGEGCASSLGLGATLWHDGSTSVGLDDLHFGGTQLPPGKPALLVAGTGLRGGGAGVPFGDGLLCTGAGVYLGVRFPDDSGGASWGPGLAAQGGWTSGGTRHFQLWYRDGVASACGSGFNASPARRVLFAP